MHRLHVLHAFYTIVKYWNEVTISFILQNLKGMRFEVSGNFVQKGFIKELYLHKTTYPYNGIYTKNHYWNVQEKKFQKRFLKIVLGAEIYMGCKLHEYLMTMARYTSFDWPYGSKKQETLVHAPKLWAEKISKRALIIVSINKSNRNYSAIFGEK